ncbi:MULTISPECIES: DUF2914 domain-containing protein [Methylomonas]|uniref:DUF2914 domain-containing protein n=2 Tax=Methylomonas TaxID=416 RepID=A0A126T988_9GAMM|nr:MULTISPECIES: DUF2914 domain-containing protein [Methylomonas]AMK78637.1 hypothetical protein JT25_019455 [Methylomonas denitrificans]OAI03637.1 hypothetical protein A1342_00710 [Methylomonas methanica]TCV83610.1 DUF2914 family protein [Methylomonas methanica]
MADNKVVIKINYDKKHSGINTEPQTVTVWHIRRILVAVLALVLMAILLFSWFGGDDEDSHTQIDATEKVQQFNKPDVEVVAQQESATVEKPVPAIVRKESVNSESVKKIDTIKKPAAIIFDRKIIRASLNSKPKDDEPGEPIKSPLRVIPNQTTEVFYFSEIKNMKGKALYHQWSRNGQIVQQKQLDLKDKIAKVWTSKTLSVKDKGEWQVQLTDKKGKVYSEVNFLVNAE